MNSEDSFIVEKIVGKRIKNGTVSENFYFLVHVVQIYNTFCWLIVGQVEYNIKWAGYSSKHNEWIKTSEMNCEEKVKQSAFQNHW